MVDVEVAAWVKGIPVAPEYHPTESEFADPITFILRVQQEVDKFGICKVVPPAPKQPRKSFLSNLTGCLAAAQGKQPSPAIKFPLQRQRLGRPASQTKGGSCTLEQFETKAKTFARGKLGTTKEVPSLALDTLFWGSMDEDKHTVVESSGELSGSAFPENGSAQGDAKKRSKEKECFSGWKLASSPWNMRYLAQLPGSLFKFMPTAVPGVTYPVVYISMLFAWSVWRTEDHELHGLNYLHTGSSKSWYAVPPEAAAAFEDVVRLHGFGSEGAGENGAVSICPELLVSNGVPCCRLVQNAGEFVVTFPRSYNLSFNHGFNCSEACKFPTPDWLKVAKQAAARRMAFRDSPPLFCHEQLLYQAALAFSKSSITSEVRSSRLKHKKKLCVDEAIKTEFVNDFIKVRQVLGNLIAMPQSKCILLAGNGSDTSTGEGGKENLCNLVNLGTIDSISLLSFVCESMEGSDEKTGQDNYCSASGHRFPRLDWGALSCAVCGILCYSCIVIIQPTLEASKSFLIDMAREDFGRRSGSINKRTGKERHTLANASKVHSDATLPASIFCPDHALQVYMQLQHRGGSRALVVYHPDYQTFDRNAEEIAKDLSMDLRPKDLHFDKGTDDDVHLINAAIDSGTANNWITRLQLTYEGVTHLTENKTTETMESDEEDELLVHKTLKEKKCWIVGRWCGRVWRYDQAHFLLGGCMNLADVHKKSPDSTEVLNFATEPEHSRAADQELKNRNVDFGNIRKNCRKKRRTQMAAVWRVESEPQTECTGLSSAPLMSSFDADSKEIGNEVAKSLNNGNQNDLNTGPHGDKLPTPTPAADDDELPIGDGVNLVSSEDEAGELVSTEVCNTEPLDRRKDDMELHRESTHSPCKEEPESTPDVGDVPLESAHEQKPCVEVCAEAPSVSEDVDELNHCNNDVKASPAGDEDFEAETFSPDRKEPQLLDLSYSHEDTDFAVPASANDDNGPGSTFCVSNNNIWHTVPISFSATFRSYFMERAQAGRSAWKPGIRTVKTEPPCSNNRRNNIQLVLDEEEEDEQRDSDQELFTSVEDESNRFADDAATTRTRRTKRKSWKALAAVENERAAKSSRKGTKKSLGSTKVSKKKSIYVEAESSDTDVVHACDFDGCTMSFSTAADLALHKRNICTIKECGKRLCSHSYLMQHYRVHVDDRPLKCPWKGCKKTFKWSWARTEHIRVHTGERPYTCNDCGKSYRFVSDFSRHKRTTGHSS